MADRYLLEIAVPGDGYLLEDGTGVLILEVAAAAADPPGSVSVQLSAMTTFGLGQQNR